MECGVQLTLRNTQEKNKGNMQLKVTEERKKKVNSFRSERKETRKVNVGGIKNLVQGRVGGQPYGEIQDRGSRHGRKAGEGQVKGRGVCVGVGYSRWVSRSPTRISPPHRVPHGAKTNALYPHDPSGSAFFLSPAPALPA